MNFIAHFRKGEDKHSSYLYVSQACFGTLAKSMLHSRMKKGWHLGAVEYIMYDNAATNFLVELAGELKLENIEIRTVKDVEDLENADRIRGLAERKSVYVPVADLPINVAMYKLFAIRNADRYIWGENRHPMFFQMYKEGRLSLLETVAFTNLVKECVPMNSNRVSSFQLHHMYNSLLIQDRTTVADFRRFIKDPSDIRSEVLHQTFKETEAGYSRSDSTYICTCFQQPAEKRHHKTKLIQEHVRIVKDSLEPRPTDSIITVAEFCKLGNYLLGRKAFNPKEKFIRKK